MPYKDPVKRRAYNRDYQKKWYAQNGKNRKQQVRERKRNIKQRMQDYKRTLCCMECGFSGAESPWALEFNHRDPSTKREIVSYLVSHGYGWSTIMEEVAKCDVLCANCHRKLHFLEMEAGAEPWSPDNTPHGMVEGGRNDRYHPKGLRQGQKDKRRRRKEAWSDRRRAGRSSDRIPGPNPEYEEE